MDEYLGEDIMNMGIELLKNWIDDSSWKVR